MSFEAKYAGICGSCTERIRPGDDVNYVEGELVHADCDIAAPVERKTETCPVCWLIRPCECEVAS